MSIERMRFVGGALHGKVVWMEHTHMTLDVHVSEQVPGASRTLHYRRNGALLCYEGESQTAGAERDTAQPPGAAGPASSTQGVA
jgi:hypothetical protein